MNFLGSIVLGIRVVVGALVVVVAVVVVASVVVVVFGVVVVVGGCVVTFVVDGMATVGSGTMKINFIVVIASFVEETINC